MYYGYAIYLPETGRASSGDHRVCLKNDTVDVCLEQGIVPSSTHEFAVGVTVVNRSDHPYSFGFEDFSLGSADAGHHFARRKTAETTAIMGRMRWSEEVIDEAITSTLPDTFTLEPKGERTGLLRFYLNEQIPDKTGGRRPVGYRHPALRELEMPLMLALAFHGTVAARTRLHLLRHKGEKATTLFLSHFGREMAFYVAHPIDYEGGELLRVEGYWLRRDKRFKIIEFSDHRFDITQMKGRSHAYRFGKFVFDDQESTTVHFQYLPQNASESARLPHPFDPKQNYQLSKSDGCWVLIVNGVTEWTAIQRLE